MTDKALAVREQQAQAPIVQHSVADLKERAELVVQAGLAPENMTPEELAVTMLKGQEVGLQPMEAIDSLYVVNGKVSEWTHLLVAQLREAGHDYRIIESTEDKCTVEFYQKGSNDPIEYTLTMAEVKKAGWNRDNKGEKYTWKSFPRVMLRYRTLSTGIKAHFPEVQHMDLKGFGKPVAEISERDLEDYIRDWVDGRLDDVEAAAEEMADKVRAVAEEMRKETRIKWTKDKVEEMRRWLEGAALTKQQALELAGVHYEVDTPKQFSELYHPNTVRELQEAISAELRKLSDEESVIDGEVVDAEGVREIDGVGGDQEELTF